MGEHPYCVGEHIGGHEVRVNCVPQALQIPKYTKQIDINTVSFGSTQQRLVVGGTYAHKVSTLDRRDE